MGRRTEEKCSKYIPIVRAAYPKSYVFNLKAQQNTAAGVYSVERI